MFNIDVLHTDGCINGHTKDVEMLRFKKKTNLIIIILESIAVNLRFELEINCMATIISITPYVSNLVDVIIIINRII